MKAVDSFRKSFLSDTTLCAIVRDEMINPAQLPDESGIRSFVETHVPHVEQAVVVDTGSVDGTRQELEQLASEFPNLKVVDHPFVNYVEARNFSIDGVKTPYTLVLDCDEVLTLDGFNKVRENLPLKEDRSAIHFLFRDVRPSGDEEDGHGQRIRFFRTGFVNYGSEDGEVWEFPYVDGVRLNDFARRVAYTEAQVYHFRPTKFATDVKLEEWYGGGRHMKHDFSRAPSNCTSFKDWKKANPFRIKYR